MSTPQPPLWPHCAHGADPVTDLVGCRGIHVPGHTTCLAHLSDAERTTYLSGLTPGADIDHRDTPFTEQLLTDFLNALRDPTTGNPHLGRAGFSGAQFSGDAWFHEAQFFGDAGFHEAQFERVSVFGPLVCAGDVVLSRAVFSLPVTLEIAARRVVAERTRWESTATIRLRDAIVDLSHAVLSAPVAVTAAAAPFTTPPGGGALGEQALTGPADVRVASVQGADAAHLVLTDTDLTNATLKERAEPTWTHVGRKIVGATE